MVKYPDGNWCMPDVQRISPLDEKRYSLLQRFLLWRIRRAANSRINLNVFRIFVRLGNIFPAYILFMRGVMLMGRISRRDKERIILRVAWRMGCVYEYDHHAVMCIKLGITQDEIDLITMEDPEELSPGLRAMLHSADDMVAGHCITERSWRGLVEYLNEDQVVEFCMLVGHYIMVAITINTLGISIEPEFS